MSDKLLNDLAYVISAHPQITGPEFQQAAQTVAMALFEDAQEMVCAAAWTDALTTAFGKTADG